MNEERSEKTPYIIHAVPPNVDSKTWADVQSKWVDVRLKELEVEKENNKTLAELAKEGMSKLEQYYLKKIPRVTIPAYVLIGAVVAGAVALTWLGRLSGETFAFLMGTVVGYIISLLSKHA